MIRESSKLNWSFATLAVSSSCQEIIVNALCPRSDSVRITPLGWKWRRANKRRMFDVAQSHILTGIMYVGEKISKSLQLFYYASGWTCQNGTMSRIPQRSTATRDIRDNSWSLFHAILKTCSRY